MNRQMSFPLFNDDLHDTKTHKKEFLAQLDQIIPWAQLIALIKPCYYEGKRGNKPYDLELMLRIRLLQYFYDLSDDGARNEVIDSRAASEFCGVDYGNQVPDGDTIGRFRNLLIRNQLQETLLAMVVRAFAEKGLLLKKGMIADAAIITAPASSKRSAANRGDAKNGQDEQAAK